MKILQTLSFDKSVSKFHDNQIKCLEEVLRKLQEDPFMGELKKGDLKDIRVYKVQMISLRALFAYKFDEKENSLILLKVGSHENFYRELE